MSIDALIGELGYADSPNFVQGDGLGQAGDYAHVFRRAQQKMNLRGVYALQQPSSKPSYRKVLVPVVYVCEAADKTDAQESRRLAWNQNAAPFLIVSTPSRIRLFSSFGYERSERASKNVLNREFGLDDVATALRGFTSHAIDDGTIWRQYGHYVTPKTRVDWTLLDALKKLDDVLIEGGLEWRTSHALIGKYFYLWYLRQRGILSDDRLGEWKIDREDVFGRHAKISVFKDVLHELDEWLNGAVFPMDWERKNAPRQEHIRKVASVFGGDDLNGQLHLPFDAYDFSVIPIETISAIYEQFLHSHEPENERTRGEELGAYYTPVPLVNFMLDELGDRRPLEEGMTCFDASCGSGAFLVQCYRRLIENRIRLDGRSLRRPAELRDLLTKHIFGLDRDGDACRVAELSLILTLLDYVHPPDLLPVHNFKLPVLHNNNIFEADFFDPDSAWTQSIPTEQRRYDWVVGNPPWVELKPPTLAEQGLAEDKNRHARRWIDNNKQRRPTGGEQLAEAFLWKVVENLKPTGAAAMLVPAMTLFKSESKELRRRFFDELDVWCVANFANLAYVLFAGRAETPATAVFCSPKASEANEGRKILCYSPLVASQEPNRPDTQHTKKDTWSIVVNASEIREVPAEDAITGDSLTWKIAMWGSSLDVALLRSVTARFESLQDLRVRLGLEMNQGVELSATGTHVPELVDKHKIETGALRGMGRIYTFPAKSLVKIRRDDANLRQGRDDLPMRVSRPPHVIVDSGRRFAVYSDDFLAVPARMIGIAGRAEHAELLKAISLFLASDFAVYHQFFTSPQFGVSKSIADLNNLKELPVPISGIHRGGLTRWSRLHAALAAASAAAQVGRTPLLDTDEPRDEAAELEAQLNEMVNEAMGFSTCERWLIEDLVHVRMRLIKGKVDPGATSPASSDEMYEYARILKQELDSFIEVVTDNRHIIEVCHEQQSAMVAIHRAPAQPLRNSIRIIGAGLQDAHSLRGVRRRLLRKHSQWVYFERALTCYSNGSTYLFRPMQRLHWLRSQALVDAGEIIADRAGGEGR